MLQTVQDMTAYFRDVVHEIKLHPREGLIHSLLTAEVDGDRLTEEEVVANSIVTMVGGQETTTNLIGTECSRCCAIPNRCSNCAMISR